MSESESLPILYSAPVDRHAVLARYGSAKLVRIQAERLKLTEKGEHGLEWEEALLVAQASLATGLSPFEPQPELWHWIAIKKGKRVLTIMRGRDGTIRLSEEAARRDGTYLLPPKFTLIEEARDRAALGFNDDDLVVMCQVFDHRAADEYYRRRKDYIAEGLETSEIDERLGSEPPADVGYGAMSLSEKSKINQYAYGVLKFPHINRVQKRAYVEALKKRWAAHINMQALADLAPSDDEAYSIEGEWQEVQVDGIKNVTPAGDPEPTAPPPGDPPPPAPEPLATSQRPYPPARVVTGVRERIEKHKGARKAEKWPGQANMTLAQVYSWQLQECFQDKGIVPEGRDAAFLADAVSKFLFDRSTVEQVTGAECRAALEWLDPSKNRDGDLIPNALAVQEARLIWREVSNVQEQA